MRLLQRRGGELKILPGSRSDILSPTFPKIHSIFWSTYHLPWRHLGGGRGRPTLVDQPHGQFPPSPLNPTTGLLKQVPGYWVANAMMGYPLTDRLNLQVNAYNLTNDYYDEPHLLDISYRGRGGRYW